MLVELSTCPCKFTCHRDCSHGHAAQEPTDADDDDGGGADDNGPPDQTQNVSGY